MSQQRKFVIVDPLNIFLCLRNYTQSTHQSEGQVIYKMSFYCLETVVLTAFHVVSSFVYLDHTITVRVNWMPIIHSFRLFSHSFVRCHFFAKYDSSRPNCQYGGFLVMSHGSCPQKERRGSDCQNWATVKFWLPTHESGKTVSYNWHSSAVLIIFELLQSFTKRLVLRCERIEPESSMTGRWLSFQMPQFGLHYAAKFKNIHAF